MIFDVSTKYIKKKQLYLLKSYYAIQKYFLNEQNRNDIKTTYVILLCSTISIEQG